MAYLKVQLCISSALDGNGKAVDMPELSTMQTEIVTTSGTSAQSTLAVSSSTQSGVVIQEPAWPRKARWILTAVGGNMYIKAGTDPTAADAGAGAVFDGDWIQDGQTLSYNVREDGEKIAVIDSTL